MLYNQSLALQMLGSSMGLGMAPELHPDAQRVRKRFQMTNLTMPNNSGSMKFALKLVPGLADVGVLRPPWVWGWPQSSTQMSAGSRKDFK